MIIRSQDKKTIVNFNNVDTIKCKITKNHETQIVYFGCGEYGGTLGTYSTEEKAIKVLDMLQDAYCKMKSSDCFCTGTLDCASELDAEVAQCMIYEHRNMYLFQMPQDSEV